MSDTLSTIHNPTEQPLIALTGAVASVYTELCGQDGATAAALALAAGVSPSAARKALVALEERGLARRTPGGNDRTRRLPDTWFATTPGSGNADDRSAPAASADSRSAEEEPGGVDRINVAVTEPGTPDDGDSDVPSPADLEVAFVEAQPTGGADDGSGAMNLMHDAPAVENTSAMPERSGDIPQPGNAPGAEDAAATANAPAESLDTPVDAVPAVCPACGARRRPAPRRPGTGDGIRLGSGQLHQLILEHLRANAGQDWSPTGISNALGRSAGAIANALATMVARGEAEITSAKPRRYRATSTE